MKRVAIFAHFDERHEVRPYVIFFLQRLRELCSEVVFVSNSNLKEQDWQRVRALSITTLVGPGKGYDFGMWQSALQKIELDAADELVLTNSSVYGPVYPLQEAFDKMGSALCDFWGMTESLEIAWHLQSYFLVFRERVLRSPALREFFESVLLYQNKHQVIRSYELGLSTFLTEQGFQASALIRVDEIAKNPKARARNPTLWGPLQLLSLRMPFVKVALLRDNPAGVSLGAVDTAVTNAGYDLALTRST